MTQLILASASPRRRELLAQLGLAVPGFSFTVLAANIDESRHHGEAAADYVSRLARQKAAAGLALWSGAEQGLSLGSDTIVVLDGDILGKPADSDDACAMLARLSGRRHQVMTAVALTDGQRCCDTRVTTEVLFAPMSDAQIRAYVASGEPMDKAGGYGIQGVGGSFVQEIHGSYSAVVGLPLVQTRALLQQMAYLPALIDTN